MLDTIAQVAQQSPEHGELVNLEDYNSAIAIDESKGEQVESLICSRKQSFN
jgi:hypothetical protein